MPWRPMVPHKYTHTHTLKSRAGRRGEGRRRARGHPRVQFKRLTLMITAAFHSLLFQLLLRLVARLQPHLGLGLLRIAGPLGSEESPDRPTAEPMSSASFWHPCRMQRAPGGPCSRVTCSGTPARRMVPGHGTSTMACMKVLLSLVRHTARSQGTPRSD